MSQINDLIYKVLGDNGFTGAINDRLYAWLSTFTVDGEFQNAITDAFVGFGVDVSGLPLENYQYNDYIFAATGNDPAFSDAWFDFWQAIDDGGESLPIGSGGVLLANYPLKSNGNNTEGAGVFDIQRADDKVFLASGVFNTVPENVGAYTGAGLLVEGDGENVLTDKVDLSGWLATGVVDTYNPVDDFNLITPDAGLGNKRFREQGKTLQIGDVVTFVTEARAAGYSFLQIVGSSNFEGGTSYANIDLANGVATQFAGLVRPPVITATADGWNIEITATTTVATANGSVGVVPIPVGTLNRFEDYSADGVSGAEIRYPQIEMAAVSSSRMLGDGSPSTRDADNATVSTVDWPTDNVQLELSIKNAAVPSTASSTLRRFFESGAAVVDSKLTVEFTDTEVRLTGLGAGAPPIAVTRASIIDDGDYDLTVSKVGATVTFTINGETANNTSGLYAIDWGSIFTLGRSAYDTAENDRSINAEYYNLRVKDITP